MRRLYKVICVKKTFPIRLKESQRLPFRRNFGKLKDNLDLRIATMAQIQRQDKRNSY